MGHGDDPHPTILEPAMRKMLFILGTLALPVGASAQKAKGVADKKTGVRVKLTQNLYDIQNDWNVLDGDEGDRTETNSFNLLNGPGRTEVTYLLGNGLELGVIGGYANASQAYDGEDVGRGYSYDIALTGAYNIKAGDVGKFFVQPIVGIGRDAYTPDGGDETVSKGVWLGGAAGLRVKLFKRVTFDPQLEYTQETFTLELDGDEVEDLEGKRSNVGVRWGLTVVL